MGAKWWHNETFGTILPQGSDLLAQGSDLLAQGPDLLEKNSKNAQFGRTFGPLFGALFRHLLT